jgi:hypothetical protein
VTLKVTLRRADGSLVRAVPDPSGGTFDAAGDFDELLDSPDLPILDAIDPYGDTTVGAAAMAALLADVDRALLTATRTTRRRLLRLARGFHGRARRARVDRLKGAPDQRR